MRVRLPDDKLPHATVDVEPPGRSVRDLLRRTLAAWPKASRGELAALEDDDAGWGMAGWEQGSGDDLEDDAAHHWDDLFELDAPLPDPLPSHLALTLTSSPFKMSFLSIPSISDGSTQVIRCLPWTTAEQLVEEVCDRHGLMRRLTLGGETRSRGKDKFGGGTKVEYVLEEVWTDDHGLELNFEVKPEAFVALLIDKPLYESPFPHLDVSPTYRFRIPEGWLLRSPRPAHPSAAPPTSTVDNETTVKSSESHADTEKPTRPDDTSGPGEGSGKRFSLFGSILSTFTAPAASEAASHTPDSPSPQAAPLRQSKGINRLSVSDPLAGPSSPSAGTPLVKDRSQQMEELADEDWEALFDRFGVQSPEAKARMKSMPAHKRAELFSKTRTSSPLSAASLSRSSSGHLQRPSLAGAPPTSFKDLDGTSTPRLEPQRTGESWGGSKRFSLASLTGWGDATEEEVDAAAQAPLAKQDTGGWSAWWSGAKQSGKDPTLTAAVKELSLSTVTNMKVRMTLGSLSCTLASATKEICEEFIELRGVDALRKVLARIVRPPVQESGDLAFQSVCEILSVVQSVMRYGGITYRTIISDEEFMMLLTLGFNVPSCAVGLRVSRLLAGFTLMADTLNTTVVLQAFSAARLLTGDRYRFQRLVDSLTTGAGWDGSDNTYLVDEHRLGLLTFIATVCAAYKADVEGRVLLREEFNSAGLKEQLVAIRYTDPPERIVECIVEWHDASAHDLDALKIHQEAILDGLVDYNSAGFQTDSITAVAMAQLRKLSSALRESEAFSSNVGGILRCVVDVVERETDAFSRDTVLDILRVCAEQVAELQDSSDWTSAIESITTILNASSDETYVPEVDRLRLQNDALQDELEALKETLRQKEFEETVFKELPPKYSESFGSSSNMLRREDGAEGIANQGLIIRLVQKERDIGQLRMQLDKLKKDGAKEAKDGDDKARRDRERAKDLKHKADLDAVQAKLQDAELTLQDSKSDLAYMQRALETVHARFRSLSLVDGGSNASTSTAQAGPEIIATELVNSLTQREEEIKSLRREVDRLRRQASARKRASASSASSQEEKDFKARVAPPPPPSSMLRNSFVFSAPANAELKTALGASRQPLAPLSSTVELEGSTIPPCPGPPPPPVVLRSSTAPPSLPPQPPSAEGDHSARVSSASGLSDVRSALFAAIRAQPKDEVDEELRLSDATPARDMHAGRAALMAAIKGKQADVSSPAPAASPSSASSSTASPSPPPPPPPPPDGASRPAGEGDADRRAALMAALRGRPAAKAAESTVPPHPYAGPSQPAGEDNTDPRAALMAALRRRPPSEAALSAMPPSPSAITPPSTPGVAASASEENDTSSAIDLRAALLAGIRKGPPVKGIVPPAPPAPRVPPTAPPSKKLKPFFWKKLTANDVQATIWGDMPAEILSLDLLELEQTFSMAPAKTPSTKNALSRSAQAFTFLDITRSNNIGILLAKLKLPIPKISQAILVFDDDTLSLDDLKSLSRLLPTAEESSRIASHEDLSKLAKPDLYFKEIGRIPRLQERLECMLFRRRLDLDLQEAQPDLEKLSAAARELRESVRLKKVLQIVLYIGNALNTSTFRGGASGFEMEALLKLKETRTARADCPTLLHFVARTIVKTHPSLALFIEDMPSISAAARINVATVNQSVSSIASGLSRVTSEIAAATSVPHRLPNDRFVPIMRDFVARVAPDVERLQALGTRVNGELEAVLAYFGESVQGPEATRPEDFFGMVLTFSMSLQSAAAEVTKHLAAPKPAPPSTGGVKRTNALLPSRTQPTLPLPNAPAPSSSSSSSSNPGLPPPAPSAGAGELDAAIRSLHQPRAASRRRHEAAERTARDGRRPLSKMFYDGAGAGAGAGATTRTLGGGGGTQGGKGREKTVKKADEARRSLGSMFNE